VQRAVHDHGTQHLDAAMLERSGWDVECVENRRRLVRAHIFTPVA
jgi:hypothetical protein